MCPCGCGAEHWFDRREQPSARVGVPGRLRRAGAPGQDRDCRNHGCWGRRRASLPVCRRPGSVDHGLQDAHPPCVGSPRAPGAGVAGPALRGTAAWAPQKDPLRLRGGHALRPQPWISGRAAVDCPGGCCRQRRPGPACSWRVRAAPAGRGCLRRGWDLHDGRRRIGSRPRTIDEYFAVEQPLLLPLPDEPFETGRVFTPRADRYSLMLTALKRLFSQFRGHVGARCSTVAARDDRRGVAAGSRVPGGSAGGLARSDRRSVGAVLPA